MPRQHRTIGPRAKVDIAALRSLPRDARLALLVEAVIDCGGASDSMNGATFRKRLADVRLRTRRAG